MPPLCTFTPAQLFAEIGNRQFESYGEFRSVLLEHFNGHVLDFPRGYSWQDALNWAVRNRIVRRDGDIIRVEPAVKTGG